MSEPLDRDTVHQALLALYDNVQLAQARLVEHFPGVQATLAVDERAEATRSLLLEALDSLRPARPLPFGSPGARSYDVLRLRYLERMRISRIEDELSIGRRQVFRDLEEAEAKLAEVLTSWARSGKDVGALASADDTLSDELLALVSSPGQVSLAEAIAEALAVVQPLAEELGKAVEAPAPGTADDYVLADASMLRQVLVQLLCCAAQASSGHVELTMAGDGDPEEAVVELRFQGRVDATQERRLADARRIALSQGIGCHLGGGPEDGWAISLHLRRGRPVSVLVVEDNPGAIELYRRYLSARCWRVHSLSDPRVTAEVARQSLPDVIVLDIMMPRLDGWSVLRHLRQQPETANIPVLVCSVVEQPELTTILGANAYLTKPVSEGAFIAALRRCLAEPGR
ncbi:MAG: response regulator [Anaerolineae bacterium]|nr:response regulator [Anaerolineae bacterium]